MNVGFIGAGKVGTALGRYLIAQGVPVTGYSSLHPASAQQAAERTQTRAFPAAAQLACASDVIFLTVPDTAIESAWHDLRSSCAALAKSTPGSQPASPLAGKIICHCSGCLPASVIDGAGDAGARVASVHPLCAVSSPLMDLAHLEGTHITLEGDADAVSALRELLEPLGNPLHAIDAARKVVYHASAVFASNLALATLDAAERLMGSCGFSGADARDALAPLIRGNVDAFIRSGAHEALTGPVERNDVDTVIHHLDALSKTDESARAIYATLSAALVDIAQAKHPERDYSELARVTRAGSDAPADAA